MKTSRTKKQKEKLYLQRIARSATKKVGYKPQKGYYFLGSLPLGTVFERTNCKGIILRASVNVQVQIFDVRKRSLEDNEYAKALVGKSIWAWATEVKIVRLGIIREEENERMD